MDAVDATGTVPVPAPVPVPVATRRCRSHGAVGVPPVDATVAMSGRAGGDTQLLPATTPDTDERRPRGRSPVLVIAAVTLLVVLVALGLTRALGSDDPSVDAQQALATTSVPTTTVAPTTAPTTAPPTTIAAPVVVTATACESLEAQRKALDDQKKQLGGGKGADKAAADAQRSALDAQKKQLDAQLKACPKR